MHTLLILTYVYGIMGFLNVMILDATDPDHAHTNGWRLIQHHFVLWPHSMWVMIHDLILNWNSKCDSH